MTPAELRLIHAQMDVDDEEFNKPDLVALNAEMDADDEASELEPGDDADPDDLAEAIAIMEAPPK
jgi:hypothetical protein